MYIIKIYYMAPFSTERYSSAASADGVMGTWSGVG